MSTSESDAPGPSATSEDEQRQCDVLVLGSGSAGASAALRCAVAGLSVVIAEKSRLLGGTSAMSGAGTWIPANHHAAAAGVGDSAQDALDYLEQMLPERAQQDRPRWEAFVEQAPRMLRFIEGETPLRFALVREPDPGAELPGGKSFGRMLSPMPLSRGLLGPHSRHLRSSTLLQLLTYQEATDLDPYHHPLRAGLQLLPRFAWRVLTRRAGQGNALMIGMLHGCMDAGCEIWLRARATRLLVNAQGRVEGALVESGGRSVRVMARRAVVVATGGFEWDPQLMAEHFPGELGRLGSPDSNEGDGQRMMAQVGAQLSRMDQANVYPCIPTRYEGRVHALPVLFQNEPHSMVVDRQGKRFVNELDFNIGEIIDERDSESSLPVHLPAWLIADSRFLRRSPTLRWYAHYDPQWIRKARSIAELAAAVELPAEALARTIQRFNRFCDAGRDEDFGRGRSHWDQYKAQGPGGLMGRIEQPPFIAIPMRRTILGTKGGGLTNASGQVLRPDGSVIAGLYAAGLAMANPFGTRAVGAGTTIGPNLTWGYICANTILRESGIDAG